MLLKCPLKPLLNVVIQYRIDLFTEESMKFDEEVMPMLCIDKHLMLPVYTYIDMKTGCLPGTRSYDMLN